MARVCQVTGKRPQVGNRRSHAMNATKHRFDINLHTHRFWVPETQRFVKLRVTSHGLKVINKKGIFAVLQTIKAQRTAGGK